MNSALPFRRFDVVDRDFTVVLRGPSLDRLEPAPATRLEPAVEREVRCLVDDRRRRRRRSSTTCATGLIGTEYGIRVLEQPEVEAGTLLVAVERVAIRGALERLAVRYELSGADVELARLLAGGYPGSVIAERLDLTPRAYAKALRTLFERVGTPDRRAFTRAIFKHGTRARRHPARSSVAAHGFSA